MSYSRVPNIDGMTSLKVDNLTYRTTPEDLKRVFEKYGDVGDVYIPRHPYTRESRGFAFVRFYDNRDAEEAMDSLDGYILDGRELRVQMARYGRPGDPRRGSRSRRRRSRSRSRSRSRRRSRSRSRRSRSRSRSRRHRSRTRSRSDSRHRRDDRSRSESPSKKKRDSKSKSRSRSLSRDKNGDRDRSGSRNKSRSRSRSDSPLKEHVGNDALRSPSRSRSRSPEMEG
ncbi:serine/arginine-rich splicing factor 2-like isoform X1 [Argiope bruennichi]|uniref:Serine/arginine-rich splicing factor 2 like protein n=1 Tax=Argiope bruennichi TaxID=94029 RepID=A0A8T0FVQ1_ARGBR|nr:serine/arginine-rich splicing factor 2-like isoform X1 [Argiope bruennichi]KAF8793640.1 Serine/arginine-rich splicing factor 2 like protein [Argiope bruennichi]